MSADTASERATQKISTTCTALPEAYMAPFSPPVAENARLIESQGMHVGMTPLPPALEQIFMTVQAVATIATVCQVCVRKWKSSVFCVCVCAGTHNLRYCSCCCCST